jgi:hypothetical protein
MGWDVCVCVCVCVCSGGNKLTATAVPGRKEHGQDSNRAAWRRCRASWASEIWRADRGDLGGSPGRWAREMGFGRGKDGEVEDLEQFVINKPLSQGRDAQEGGGRN